MSFGARLVLASWVTGCASTSIGSDIDRVRELTRAPTLAEVADTDVDPAVPAEARKLIEKPLDVETAVRVALLNNRELRATLREMGIARGRLVQAGLLPNPSAEAEFFPEPSTSLELRVEYDITSAIFAPVRANAAEPELEASRYRAADAVVELGGRVRSAFYGLQAAEERLLLSHQALDAWAAAVEASRAMFRAGNVSELDLAGNEAAYERARATVAEIELERTTARERLLRVLGLEGMDTAIRLEGPLAPLPKDDRVPRNVEMRAVRANLELREARERLVGLSRAVGLSDATGIVPDISVDVHALRDRETSGAPSDEDEWSYGAGLRVGIPLFDRHQGTSAALQAEFDALLERYYGMAVDVRSAAREARARVSSARARATQYATVVLPAEKRVVEQTLLQYNAMQVGVFQLLAARRDELDAHFSYLEALRDYWTANAELEALLAGKRLANNGKDRSRSFGDDRRRDGGH